MNINTYAKTLLVAKSLLDLCHYTGYPNITPLKIVKLTYITHGWTLGMTGKPLLDEPAEAWKYGPVIPSLFHTVKLYGDNPIDDIPIYATSIKFSMEEKIIMEGIVDGYAKMTELQLSTLKKQEVSTPHGLVG